MLLLLLLLLLLSLLPLGGPPDLDSPPTVIFTFGGESDSGAVWPDPTARRSTNGDFLVGGRGGGRARRHGGLKIMTPLSIDPKTIRIGVFGLRN